MEYPKFEVPGIKPEDVWQLFNCSNYAYYLMKVRSLLGGTCDFCTINRDTNRVYFETQFWTVMENSVAPRGDQASQEHQFVIPSKRHVFSFNELLSIEVANLSFVIGEIDKSFGITGGVIVIRTGDPAKNARSMPHLHVNYHVPTGLQRVEITIAKSVADLEKKLPILHIFEKLRLLEEHGHNLIEAIDSLSPEEHALVGDKIEPKGSC